MATDPRPQSSTSFRGGGALGGGESLLNFEEGKKAAAKAEFFTVPPEATFLGGETYRDKIRGALRSLGADDRSINYVVGDMRADNFVDNIGLLDLTPAAIPLAVQEGSRAFKQGRYLEGSLDLGLSALEMIPGIKLATTPIKGFLNSIASKLSKSTDNLGALPTDPSRREFIASAVATPVVAGALGDLPVSKMIDDVAPVVKKSFLKKINLSSLGSFKKRMDEAVDMAIGEGREFDSELIETMDTDEFMEEIIGAEMGGVEDFKGSTLEKMIDEIKETSPELTDQQIFDNLSESISDLDELIPQSKLSYKIADSYNASELMPKELSDKLNSKAIPTESSINSNDFTTEKLKDIYENPQEYRIKTGSFLGSKYYYFGDTNGDTFGEYVLETKEEVDAFKDWLKAAKKRK